MDLDVDVSRWVLELLLRDRDKESVAKRVLAVAPLSDHDWRLKKTLLLRSIESQIFDEASVSESILESLESIEVLDRGQGIPVTDAMRAAYCAVATELTVRFLVCFRGKPGGKYMEAVDRIWRGRVRVLEETEGCELVSAELKERRDEVEAGIWDMKVSKKLASLNSRNDALRLVAAYVKEAMAMLGPPFIAWAVRFNTEKGSISSEGEQVAVENDGNVGDGRVRVANGVDLEVQTVNGADLDAQMANGDNVPYGSELKAQRGDNVNSVSEQEAQKANVANDVSNASEREAHDTTVSDESESQVVTLACVNSTSEMDHHTTNGVQLQVAASKLGSDDMDNITVFTENDSSFCVDITSTKDGKFITVNSNSRTSSEVYLIDSTNPLGGLQKVWKRISGVQYFLEHHLGTFYVLTNAPSNESKAWSGEGYYLATCSVEDILSSNWQNIILPSEDFTIQDMDMFNGHLVLSLNKKDYSIFCSIDLPMAVDCKHQVKIEDLNPWFFPLPSNSCTVAPGSNHDFQNSSYRVVLSSPVMPDVVIDYDMPTRRFSVVQQEEVIGFRGTSPPANELDMNQTLVQLNEKDRNVHISESQTWKDFSGEYCCERREVVSHDGVSVPLTVLYSHTAWKKGQSPGLLHGYGAYGEVLDKSWCTDQLSLLDRGWVVAFADVRGSGGDSSWHEAGRRFNKLNSIHDFVSCGNYLIKEGYVHRDQLGAIGCSAGGLLVGATINMYPDLFRAAILKVPFLDVCNTLMDPSLPLTILDYEEFGNPQIKSQFENILSYSPYDNISQGSCYPSMLVRASFHDSRVGFWEAAKWVAKIRDSTCPHCSSSVILKTNMGGGHFGEGGRYAQSEETAYDYAFLIKAMGMLKNEK